MNELIEEFLEVISDMQNKMNDHSDDAFHTALIFAQQLEEELQSLVEE